MRWWTRLRKFAKRPGPMILMYHRIADPSYDPWGLSVTAERFAEQMRAIKMSRVPLSMNDFVENLRHGTLPRLAVGVTFDDGYIDNLDVAKPVLDTLGVPATVFLTTDAVAAGREFWWDELARLVLGRQDAAECSCEVAGHRIFIRLPEASPMLDTRSTWRAWEPAQTEREKLYFHIWSLLREEKLGEREASMGALRQVLQHGARDAAALPMKPTDVPILVTGACLDVGAHSQTHQALTTLPLEERRREIDGSRVACETLVGRSVAGFSYPHGDVDADTKRLVRDSGLQWACSTHEAPVDPSRFDLFDLPRVQVLNWTGEKLIAALASGSDGT